MSQDASSKLLDQILNKTPDPDSASQATRVSFSKAESSAAYSQNTSETTEDSSDDSSSDDLSDEEDYDSIPIGSKKASFASSSRRTTIFDRAKSLDMDQELKKRQRDRMHGKAPAPDAFPPRDILLRRQQLLLEVDAWFQRGVAAQELPPTSSASFDNLGEPILKIEQVPRILADSTKNDLMGSLEELLATYKRSSNFLDDNSKKMATVGLELLRLLRKMVEDDNKQRDKRNAAAKKLKSAIPSDLDLTKIGIEVFESEELRDDIFKWQTSVQAIEGLFNCGEALCPSAFKKKFTKVLKNGQQLFLNIEKLHHLMKDKAKNDAITENNLHSKLDSYNRQLSETTTSIVHADNKISSMKEELPKAKSELLKVEMVTEKLKKKVTEAKTELTAAFENEANKVNKLRTEVEEVKATNSILEIEEKRMQAFVSSLEVTASSLEERKPLLEDLRTLGMPETEIAELQVAPIEYLMELVEKWKSKAVKKTDSKEKVSPKKKKSPPGSPPVKPSVLEEALKKIKTKEKAFLEEMHMTLPSALVTPKKVSVAQSEASFNSKDANSDTSSVDSKKRRKSSKWLAQQKQKPPSKKTLQQKVLPAQEGTRSEEELKSTGPLGTSEDKATSVNTEHDEAVKTTSPSQSKHTGRRRSTESEEGKFKKPSTKNKSTRERSVSFSEGILKTGERGIADSEESAFKGTSTMSKTGSKRKDISQKEGTFEATGSQEKVSGRKEGAGRGKGSGKGSPQDGSSQGPSDLSTNQNASPESTSGVEADTQILRARQAAASTKQTSKDKSSHGLLESSLGRNNQTIDGDLNIVTVGGGSKQSHSPSNSNPGGRAIQVKQRVKMTRPEVISSRGLADLPGQSSPHNSSSSSFNRRGRPSLNANTSANADLSGSDLADPEMEGLKGLEVPAEEEAAHEADQQKHDLFTEQAVSFKAGVLQGVQDFKEMRNRMVAQLIKHDLRIHAEILKADLYGFAAGEYANDSELFDNLRSTAQPTMSDFQDIISNAIRELKDRQKTECEKAASALMKTGAAGPKWLSQRSVSDVSLEKAKGTETSTLPTGLEAWSQSHEAFKQKEKEYASFLSRYRALWMMYNKERADLIKPLPADHVPATSTEELLHRVSEEFEEEEKPAEPPLEMTPAWSTTKKEDEPLPKGTSISNQWKENLSAAKSAFDEGALCYDEYMEQVQTCLKMAAILQQRAMLLGDSYPEVRLKQALTQRVEDILKEVHLKKQKLRTMVRDLGNRYSETMTGLDNMEKAIIIEQEQARLMILMKKAHTNMRRNMICGMKAARMRSLREEEEVAEEEEEMYEENEINNIEEENEELKEEVEAAQDEKIVEEEKRPEAVAETDADREDDQIVRIQDEGMFSPPSSSTQQDGITSQSQSLGLRKVAVFSSPYEESEGSLTSSPIPSIAISTEDMHVTLTLGKMPKLNEDEESAAFRRRLSLTPSNLIANAAMGVDADSSGPFLDLTDRPHSSSAINLRPSLVMFSHALDEALSDHNVKALDLHAPDLIPPHRSLLYPRVLKVTQPCIVGNSSGLCLVPETKPRRQGRVTFDLPQGGSSLSIATSATPNSCKDVVLTPLPVAHALFLRQEYLSPRGQISKKLPGPSKRQQLPLLVKHPRLSLTGDSKVVLRSSMPSKADHRPVAQQPIQRVHAASAFQRQTPKVASQPGLTATSPIDSLLSQDQEWSRTRLDPLQFNLTSGFTASSPYMFGPLPTPISGHPPLYDRSPIHPKFLSKQPVPTIIVRPISPELGIRVVVPCAEQEEGSATYDNDASTAAPSLASSLAFSQTAVSPSLTDTITPRSLSVSPTSQRSSQSPPLTSLERGSMRKTKTGKGEEETESEASGTSPMEESRPSLPLPPFLTSLPTPSPQPSSPNYTGESYDESPPVSLKKGPVVFLDMAESENLPGEIPFTLAERLPSLRSSPCSPLLPLTSLLPTPHMLRPFDGADLQEYLQTLPPQGPTAAAVERSERPRTFLKLQNLREMSGLSVESCLPSTPRLSSPEIKKVVRWVKGSEALQVPMPPPGVTASLKHLKQHRQALRIMEKGGKRLGYRVSRTSRRVSDVMCCPMLKEEMEEAEDADKLCVHTPEMLESQHSRSGPTLPARSNQPESPGWQTTDPGFVPMLESRLLCMDVDQSRRKASNALQLVSSFKTYRLPYDPTCKQVWNKFLTSRH